jgi:hypothetical protein
MRIAFIGVVAALCACGGGSAESGGGQEELPDDPYADGTEGDVGTEDVGDEGGGLGGSGGEATPPSGPVQVTIAVRLGSEEGTAAVKLVDADGNTVAEGRSGQSFTVRPGAYTVIAQIEDERVMIDKPQHSEEVQVPASEEPHTIQVSVPIARVRLVVRRNNRPLNNPQVTLFRQSGEEVATFRAGNDHIAITPGRYEADVVTGRDRIRVRGLTFMDGATQNIPVNIQ